MTTYVLLRFDKDEDANTLVEDMREYPGHELLTPYQEHFVHATLAYVGDNTRITYYGEDDSTWVSVRVTERGHGNPIHDECNGGER